MKNIFNKIINLISPEDIKCIVCDDELDHNTKHCMCDTCLNNLPTIKKPCIRCGAEMFDSGKVCIDCKAEVRLFKQSIAPFNFCDQIVSLVYRLKYGAETYLAKYMAYFMTNCVVNNNIDFDIIIPVPLSDKRLKLRGFNQAELLVKYIAQDLGKPIELTSLIRLRDTLTQTHLSKQERKDNLKQAFDITDKSKIKGKNILLVDDIFTTGATSEEITKVLLNSGAKNVVVVTFAHAINKKEQAKTKNISKNN